MSKRTMIVMLLLLVAPMLLAACGGNPSEGDIEEALSDAFKGEFDKINDIVCDDEKIEEGDADAPPEFGDISVDCSVDGDNFTCDYEIPELGTARVSGEFVDGKVCNVSDPEFVEE